MRLSEWPLIFQANHTPLNQRVPGSSPGAPTKLFKDLTGSPEDQNENVLTHLDVI
jgi:hypothetical protein